MRISILTTILCLCLGCNKKSEDVLTYEPVVKMPTGSLAGPPELMSETEPDFKDFAFFVSKFEEKKDGLHLAAEATYKSKPLKIELLISGAWKVLDASTPNKIRGGEVRFHLTGEAGANLVNAIATEYVVKAGPSKMATEVHAIALSLEGNPATAGKEVTKIKLFFNDEGEKDYAELFCNLDLPRRRLTLAEKDESYRKALFRCFSGEAKTTFRSSSEQEATVNVYTPD